jgi:hypothetical protein
MAHQVGAYDVPTDTDIRLLPGYQAAKTTRTLAVTEPSINPDTGFPILFLRVPIFHGVDFVGCATANITITIDVLSRFLDKHRASAHSTALIAHRNNGKIIAFPDKQKGVRIGDEPSRSQPWLISTIPTCARLTASTLVPVPTDLSFNRQGTERILSRPSPISRVASASPGR